MIFRSVAASVLLTVLCAPADAATKLLEKWALTSTQDPPLDYLGTGNSERGMGYNPVTNHLLLVSRANGNRVIVLDADTGAYLHDLDTTGVSGGIFPLSAIDVADDGKVYASNLTTSTTSADLRVYQWPSDAEMVPDPLDPPTMIPNSPVMVASGNPSTLGDNLRWGDTFDVSGGGPSTRLIFGAGTAGAATCILSTSDGEVFGPVVIPASLESGDSKGICFGDGTTFYSKAGGSTKKIRRSSYDLNVGTATVLNEYTTPNNAFGAIAADPAGHLFAALELHAANRNKIHLFDITDTSVNPVFLDAKNLPPDMKQANTNGVGAVAFGGHKLFVLSTNNSIAAYDIEITAEILPPAISDGPLARTAFVGGQTTFSVLATGSPPLSYQWYLGDTPLTGATSASLTLNPVTEGDAGAYKCVVRNADPQAAESLPAVLTTAARLSTEALTAGWRLAPGSKPWLTGSDSERGMAYSKVTNRLYLLSRAAGVSIHVLNADDGVESGQLDMSGVTLAAGATFILNAVGVDGDGAIYAASLTTTGSGFRVYKWENDDPATIASVVYDGNPLAGRFGDSIDVRGRGDGVEILAGTRTGTEFVILKWNPDILLFESHALVSDAPAGSFGLCARFGEGRSVWGKSTGTSLVNVSYDLQILTASTRATFPATNVPGSGAAFHLDLTTGSLVLLQLANSDNVRLYDIPVPFPATAPETLEYLDQEFIVTDNANVNGTGAVAISGNRAWVLDTGNGISSYTILKAISSFDFRITGITADPSGLHLTFTGTPGKTYQIEKSSNLSPDNSWTVETTVAADTPMETVTFPIVPGTTRLYYRVRELP